MASITRTRRRAIPGRDPRLGAHDRRVGDRLEVRWSICSSLVFGSRSKERSSPQLHGLQFQWFAVLQSRLLTAMTGLDTGGN